MKLKGIELKGTYKVRFDDNWFEVFDDKGNEIYNEYDNGDWVKSEYDEIGNEIYYEDRDGCIIDNRVKVMTIQEIEKLLGYKIKIKGESK